MFAHVSVLGVLFAAAAAMIIGTVWYSSSLFGKEWQELMNTNDKAMQKKMRTAMPTLIVVSLVTAYVLSLFTTYMHAYTKSGWLAAGLMTGFLAWIGIATTALVAHSVFDPRSRKLLYINTSNRLATLLAMGLIIGAFTH